MPDEDNFVMQPRFKHVLKREVNYGTRAAVDTIIVGVSFLMYASRTALFRTEPLLMTSSVLFVTPKDTNYILSFLSGIFIGSLAVGRRAD